MAIAVTLLRILLLSSHLVANALACGAPLLAALAPVKDETRRRLAWFGLWGLAVGALTGGLGVTLALSGGLPGYAEAAARLPVRAYMMLAGELVFTVGLYLAYLLLWDRLAGRRVLHGLIALVSATNLMYHYPTMMIVLGNLAENPSLSSEQVVNRAAFLKALLQPLPLAQTFHYWSLCLLATGVGLMQLSTRDSDRRWGAGVALGAVVALLLTGIWSMMQLPDGRSRVLMDVGTVTGGLFLGGVACGVLMLFTLSSGVAGNARSKKPSLLLALTAVLLMTASAIRA